MPVKVMYKVSDCPTRTIELTGKWKIAKIDGVCTLFLERRMCEMVPVKKESMVRFFPRLYFKHVRLVAEEQENTSWAHEDNLHIHEEGDVNNCASHNQGYGYVDWSKIDLSGLNYVFGD